MLVLSRGATDKVTFPTLGITVEILRIKGNRVRLGIDAPDEIPVLRHEIAADVASLPNRSAEQMHRLRNKIQMACLSLHVLQKKLENNLPEEVELTLFKALHELDSIDVELGDKLARPSTTARDSRRALLVDDNPNETELLAAYLRMSGFEVETADDGLKAMVYLARHQLPDIVLLDMHMPRFNGRKTIEAIRNNPDYRNVKVFALTGAKPAEAGVAVGPKGVDRWYTKPINPDRLVQEIDHELHSACLVAQ